ncbi:sporulation protein YtfJ [Keratinibaculum paraultunense]|uniref:Sporulation protein YtfJ n=1 Tax=Keratinibaculum paraultunense TaxID=1278232 RepID=A0A4R3L432_9FIRM|nr:GerW family sporulation protein [Keratinibaculum paraultunense]QQY80640.1 GerW family sporulation protein [Keratinibaculum paraultunense]TCS91373.1 sporulation protein YtfJ [Keratinibaculum paraultunense]
MSEHPIEGLMHTTMNSLKEMVDVNTIIGDPVQSEDGLIIIPVSKICFGFASGGTEFKKILNNKETNISDEKLPFGGGSGAGVSVQPVGFIVVGNDQIKLLTVDEGNTALSSLFDFLGKVVDNVQESMTKNKAKNDYDDSIDIS